MTAMQGFYRVQSTQALVLPSEELQASAFASMGLNLQQLIAVSRLHSQVGVVALHAVPLPQQQPVPPDNCLGHAHTGICTLRFRIDRQFVIEL